MDALTEARNNVEWAESASDSVLAIAHSQVAIAWGLVAVCERLDRWLEMRELEAEREELLQGLG